MTHPTANDELTDDELLIEVSLAARRFAAEIVDGDEAEDLAQDVVLECLARLRLGRWQIRPTSLGGLVRSMVRRRAIDLLRKQMVRLSNTPELIEELLGRAPVWMSPDLELEEQELIALREHTLSSLSPSCRRAFVMVREERASYRVVAERMGVSRSTVCQHVVTAQRRFRSELVEHDIPAPQPAGRGRPVLRARSTWTLMEDE